MTVVINGAFRPQRVSGQQRYAIEIADRLATLPEFREVAPAGRWSGSALREWGWVFAKLPALDRGDTLLSLTARAPLRRRQVLVVHDLFVLTDPQWYSRSYVATHAPLLRAQLRRAETLVAVSEPVADQVADVLGRRPAVAPNAPSVVFQRSTDHADASVVEHRGLIRSRYLLAVGSMDARKNLPRLASAYGMLDAAVRAEYPLVVVGGSADIYRAGAVEWPEGTRMLGYVDDDELRELYAAATAVVFPSLAEGFGLPLVEAVAAGARALVVSDIPVFRWICGAGAAYVDPLSEEAICALLVDAIEGRTPQASVTRTFDWDASAAVVADACLNSGRVAA